MISFLLKMLGDPNEKKVKKILGQPNGHLWQYLKGVRNTELSNSVSSSQK